MFIKLVLCHNVYSDPTETCPLPYARDFWKLGSKSLLARLERTTCPAECRVLSRGAGLPIEQTRRRVGVAIDGAIVRESVEDSKVWISAFSGRLGDFCRRLCLRETFGDGISGEIESSSSCVI